DANVLVTLPVPTSSKQTASPINVAATCLPSGVNVNQSVTDRPPPDAGKYLNLRSPFPVAASQRQTSLSSLVARVFPSGDSPTASVFDPRSSGREYRQRPSVRSNTRAGEARPHQLATAASLPSADTAMLSIRVP